MIKQRVEVPIYGYTIWLVKLSFDDYKKEVRPTTASIGLKSKRIGLDEETCAEIDENIKAGDYNGAITCHRANQREIVIFFYPIDSEEKAIEIYDHEKRHVEDFILDRLDVDDKEASAYLAGYLGKVLWKFRNK